MKKVYYLLLISFVSCSMDRDHTANTHKIFAKVQSSHSGITFSNNLHEDEKKNYLNFEYIYNGGGVAVGDINNDGLPDLYFSGNEVPNRLYLNQGQLKFKDITEEAGVAVPNGWKTGVTMIDINNDGFLDIYVCRSDWQIGARTSRSNLLFVNNGDFTFAERAEEFGLNDSGFSIQSTFFDADNDGDLDMYLTNHPMEFGPIKNRENKINQSADDYRDKLYRNEGTNLFTEVGVQSGIQNYSHGLDLIATDINQDGWQDIYVTNDYEEQDFLYINQKDGSFKDEIKQWTNHVSMFAMGVDIGDINNDGLLDIFTTEMLPYDYKRSKTNMASMSTEKFYRMVDQGLHYQYMHNSLQLNTGSNFFSEVSQFAGVDKTDWSWTCLMEDFDNDGYKDILVTNGYKRDVFNKDFAKTSAQIINKNKGSIPIKELYEIMPSKKLRNFLFINQGDITFKDKAYEWGLIEETLTQGAAVSDLDNDGDLDLVFNNLDEKSTIYENHSKSKNYLQVKLVGSANNKLAIGSTINLYTGQQKQVKQILTSRGFQSASQLIAHFGLGNRSVVDSLIIQWSDNTISKYLNLSVNQLLKLEHGKSLHQPYKPYNIEQPLFRETSDIFISPQFIHNENEFDDYEKQILLPHKLSALGPFIEVGDINGDGKDDFFIGGAHNQAGRTYVQMHNEFVWKKNKEIEQDSNYEDMGASLFDYDNDGDLDLYVVSGGSEFPAKHSYYQDRIYKNNGKGTFTKANILPKIMASGSCVIPNDYDNDGDLDLFVGGRVIPDYYPLSTQSYLLNNHDGVFIDVAMKQAPEIVLQGMVTSAVWVDYNKDGWTDLITVGEWMPINFFKNINGFFQLDNGPLREQKLSGWWNKIIASDYDQDGDLDLIAGNLGDNYKFHASINSPFRIYAKDYDKNNTLDIFLAKKLDNQYVPIRGRECASQQLPAVSSKFPTYESFAEANIDQILGEETISSLQYEANTFRSKILINENGIFRAIDLPFSAQIAPVNGMISHDFDKDGILELIIGGNMFGSEPETTRADSGKGYYFTYDSIIGYKLKSDAGFNIPFDVKDIKLINLDNNDFVLVSTNDDKLRLFKFNF